MSDKDINSFYETELAFRRQSDLPPFKHIIIVKLRGKNKDRVELVTEELFNILKNTNHDKTTKVICFSSQMPPKKRDNFYEQIMIKANTNTRLEK